MSYEEALVAMLQGKLVKNVEDTQGYYYMYNKEARSFEKMNYNGTRSWYLNLEDISDLTFEIYTLPVYGYQYLFRLRGINEAFQITPHLLSIPEDDKFEYKVVLSSKRQVCV